MMKLPKKKPVDNQLRLFRSDRLIDTEGEARWLVGEFYEEATSRLTGADRLKTDATCNICPDLKFSEDTYGEVKGCGRNSSVIFYEPRMEKDRRFMEEHDCKIVYWFWSHDSRVIGAESRDELYGRLANRTKSLYIVDHELLWRSVEGKAVRKVNSGYTAAGVPLGYGNPKSGGVGWTIRLSFFHENSQQVFCPVSFSVFDVHKIGGIEVYTSKPELTELLNLREHQTTFDFECDDG